MGLKNIINKIKEEAEVLKGDASKDKVYSTDNTYPDAASARQGFEDSRRKLFDINRWSDLPGINSKFVLYDQHGNEISGPLTMPGCYIRINLPGPTPENWVRVTDVHEEENMAEFIVHPSEKPQPEPGNKNVTEHFFAKEASSTFRVELRGNKLTAYEIGKNEAINNKGEEAGDRGLANTLLAEGGWAGVQALQWNKLTSYLVHQTETKSN
ncbi:hypothetical protein [Pontibacter pudoricolor]|uniref:hypothetical protein n=1 Tax=Pontibacter pudoricolor TaxID=2694930 RepID=UPI001390D45B|nr:hypothetical protein [Pontibacter pudoricolor]